MFLVLYNKNIIISNRIDITHTRNSKGYLYCLATYCDSFA